MLCYYHLLFRKCQQDFKTLSIFVELCTIWIGQKRWLIKTQEWVGAVNSHFLFCLLLCCFLRWQNKSSLSFIKEGREEKAENVAKIKTSQRNVENYLNSSITILALVGIKKGYCSFKSQKEKKKAKKWICGIKLRKLMSKNSQGLLWSLIKWILLVLSFYSKKHLIHTHLPLIWPNNKEK